MDFRAVTFYFFAAVMVFAALRVITARNPVHSALFLVLAFFTAAGLWMTAAIGMACGLGRELTAVLSALLALAVLSLVPRLVALIERVVGPPADDGAKPRVIAAPDDTAGRR